MRMNGRFYWRVFYLLAGDSVVSLFCSIFFGGVIYAGAVGEWYFFCSYGVWRWIARCVRDMNFDEMNWADSTNDEYHRLNRREKWINVNQKKSNWMEISYRIRSLQCDTSKESIFQKSPEANVFFFKWVYAFNCYQLFKFEGSKKYHSHLIIKVRNQMYAVDLQQRVIECASRPFDAFVQSDEKCTEMDGRCTTNQGGMAESHTHAFRHLDLNENKTDRQK